MGNEVTFEKIGDHSTVYSGFAFKSKDLGGNGIPVVKIKNVKNKTVDLSDTQFFPENLTTDKHDKFYLKNGDVLIAMTGQGSVGRVGRLSIKKDFPVLLNQRVGRFEVKPSLDLKYLYYVLSSKYYENILFNAASGSGQPNLSPSIISNIEIPFVNVNLQKAIAHILGTLDDKIELNRQMNETLESMAQALFKSWFVDFDPVIDNALAEGNAIPDVFAERAEQRNPSPPAPLPEVEGSKNNPPLPSGEGLGVRELFPSEFEYTEEMGWIPKGWSVSSTGEEFNTVGGATPSTKNEVFWEGGNIYWTTPKDLSNNQTKILLNTARKITPEGLKKISSGLLPIDTILMSSRAPVGYLALAKIPVAINQGYIAIKCEKTLTPEYAIQWTDAIMDDIKQRAGGTTFAEISKKSFRDIPLFVPEKETVDSFSKTVNEFYNQITNNDQITLTLTKLRDTLLPKLLSGELRIPDAEKLIAEAI